MTLGRETVHVWVRVHVNGNLAGATLHRPDVITSVASVRVTGMGFDITLHYHSREGRKFWGAFKILSLYVGRMRSTDFRHVDRCSRAEMSQQHQCLASYRAGLYKLTTPLHISFSSTTLRFKPSSKPVWQTE
jgi:hypothetical protein